MKRVFVFIICLQFSLSPIIYGQSTTTQIGLSSDSYELPSTRNSFTNFSTSSYYQPLFGAQKSVPQMTLNKKQLKRDKTLSLFVNALLLLNVSNQGNSFGSIGLSSPAFNPLINTLSSPNDYLLLQQHEFQRNNMLPTFLPSPKALQLRF